MAWFWLNVPLGVLFVLAIAGIPFWMVIRHPDSRRAGTDTAGAGVTRHAGSVTVAGLREWPSGPAETWDSRELVGASADDRG